MAGEYQFQFLMQQLANNPLLRSLLSPQVGPSESERQMLGMDTMPQTDFSMAIPAAGAMKALSAPKAVASTVKPWMGSAESKIIQSSVPYLEDITSSGGAGGTIYMRFDPTKGPTISKEFATSLRDLAGNLGYQVEVIPLHSNLVGGSRLVTINVFDKAGRVTDEIPLLSKLREIFGFME